MINIAVCDDCPIQVEVIKTLLKKYQADRPGVELCTHSFSSGSELLKCVNSGQCFNIFLLDILMPGLSGMDVAVRLREWDADVPLIFLTSSKDYALEAYSVSAVQYIIKPITELKLFPVLDNLIAMLKLMKEPVFALKMKGRIVSIPFASVSYVELVNRSIQVNLWDGTSLMSSSLRMSFSEVMLPLLEDDRFLCSHMSFVLNMTHVLNMGGDSFTMKNGVQIPVSKRKYAEAKTKYLTFLSEHRGDRG